MFKKVHVFRVKPRQEVASEVASYCRQNGISSGVVLGIIGSVEKASLNFLRELPGKYETKEYQGPLEIVCAQGSVALKDAEPVIHIHIQLGIDTSSTASVPDDTMAVNEFLLKKIGVFSCFISGNLSYCHEYKMLAIE